MAVRKLEKKLSEAELNSPDLDEGEVDVEHFPLPSGDDIGDEYFREVWEIAKGIVEETSQTESDSINQQLSWESYNGKHGGHGWRNTSTGEVRYQDEKPGDDDGAQADKPSGETLTREDLQAVHAKIPEEDRTGDKWQKVKSVLANLAVKAANTLNDVAIKAALLAPEVFDTAQDWMSLKMAREYDVLRQHTGIGTNTLLVITSHVLTRALNKAGIRLAQSAADQVELTALVMQAINAIIDALELPIEKPNEAEVGEMLQKRIDGKSDKSE